MRKTCALLSACMLVLCVCGCSNIEVRQKGGNSPDHRRNIGEVDSNARSIETRILQDGIPDFTGFSSVSDFDVWAQFARDNVSTPVQDKYGKNAFYFGDGWYGHALLTNLDGKLLQEKIATTQGLLMPVYDFYIDKYGQPRPRLNKLKTESRYAAYTKDLGLRLVPISETYRLHDRLIEVALAGKNTDVGSRRWYVEVLKDIQGLPQWLIFDLAVYDYYRIAALDYLRNKNTGAIEYSPEKLSDYFNDTDLWQGPLATLLDSRVFILSIAMVENVNQPSNFEVLAMNWNFCEVESVSARRKWISTVTNSRSEFIRSIELLIGEQDRKASMQDRICPQVLHSVGIFGGLTSQRIK